MRTRIISFSWFLGDLPVAEVARETGAPVGTVKARLSRGRAALARLLDDPALDPHTDSHTGSHTGPAREEAPHD